MLALAFYGLRLQRRGLLLQQCLALQGQGLRLHIFGPQVFQQQDLFLRQMGGLLHLLLQIFDMRCL